MILKILRFIALVLFGFTGHQGLSQHIVISEVFGGGGNSGSTYKNDFVELYNPTSNPVSLTGWSIQYAAAAGTGIWQVTALSGIIYPGSYYLVQEAAGTGGVLNLPDPDAIGTIGLASTSGKIALVSSSSALSGSCPAGVIDEVGIGPASNCFEGAGPASSISNTTSAERKANAFSTGVSMSPGGLDELSGNGFDTDNNVNDFVTRNPQPQNSASKIEPDIVPPMFASGYPLVVNPSENSCELVLNMNEAGKIHYVVLPSGAAAPSSLQVTLGQDSNGSVASIKGSVPITIVDSDISKTIADLQSSTSYYVYAVGRDVAGNLQVSPVRIEVTTTESTVPVITPSLSSLDFPGFTDKSKQSISRLYSIAADHLVSNMIVSVSGNFHISEDDINYTSSLTINKNLLSGGALKVIYVKFNPGGNVGTQPGIITHSSTGAADQQIFLSGNAIDPFVQDFNDPDFLLKSGWTQFSRLGDQTWASTNFGHTCLTACTSATADKAAQINGFSGGAIENEDWLISPNLDLTGFVNFPVISFWTVSAFAGNGLKLKYSSDYPGSGDPALATWTDLDGKFPVPNSSLWTRSSGIILPKTLVYVAIVYTSGIDAASRWTFDDWKVEDASGYLDVPVILFSFGEVVTGSHSASQNFAFVSKGYGDVTVSAPEGFEISLDDISFANSQVIPQANVSSGKTIYIRFSPPAKRIKWNGTLVFTGNGLDTSLGSLAGSSYPRSETFDITTYNLEFFGTDVKNASNKEFGPLDDALQTANVSAIMQKLGSDIYAVEEVSDETAFNQLVANLPDYNRILSPRWSYSFDPPDPHFPPQKIGFIYDKSTVEIVSSRVMFEKLFDDIKGGRATLPSYPGEASGSFWSSGRLPFMVTFKVTVNGVEKKIRVIGIHAKSGSSSEDYARRKYDVQVLHDSLATRYPADHIILLGDFNDDVDASINVGSTSSFRSFVDDVANFNVLTYALSQAGGFSFPGTGSFLDHIIVSNELTSSYLANSVTVEDVRSSISNYLNTTSDHLPVTARFQLEKNEQSVTFTALDDKTVGDPAFSLTGSASSGLDLVYSTTSDKIMIDRNKVMIVKEGRATITAGQPGNANYNGAASVDRSFCIKPARPVVTLSNLNTEAPVLTSSAASGNQWYFNGAIIASATNTTLSVNAPGLYKVQSRVEDCTSAFSSDIPVLVTGDRMSQRDLKVYPNPATDFIDVQGVNEISGSSVTDMLGQINRIIFQKNDGYYRGSAEHLVPGVYLLRIQDGPIVHQVKFIKK